MTAVQPEPLTDAELAAIEARAAAATSGEWVAVYNPQFPGVGAEVYCLHHGKIADREPDKRRRRRKATTMEEAAALPEGYSGIKPADAVFIAAARADVPRLAAEVRRLRALLKHAPPA